MLSSSAAFFLGVVPAIVVALWWCIIHESAKRREILYVENLRECVRRNEALKEQIKNAEPGEIIRYEGDRIPPALLVNMTKARVAGSFPAGPDGCFLCANKYPHRDVGAPGDHLYEFQVEPRLKLYLEWRKDALNLDMDLGALAEKWHAGVPMDPKPWKALLKTWDRFDRDAFKVRNFLFNYGELSALEKSVMDPHVLAAMSWRSAGLKPGKAEMVQADYLDHELHVSLHNAALNREITRQAAETRAFVSACSKHPKVVFTATMPCRSCERDRLAKPYAKGEGTLDDIIRYYS